MKLFWGKESPHNATFHCRTFLGEEFFSGVPEWVKLPAPQTMKPMKSTFLPEKKEWTEMVRRAIKEIQAGKIEKIVLARSVILDLPEIPDPFAITASLQKNSKGATLFCLQKGDISFLGATPEKLFSRHGLAIECEAMAGTRWHGTQFGGKEMREFTPIQTFLRDSLQSVCIEPLVFSEVGVHETHNLQHLRSIAHGKLSPHVTDQQIADCLHPTPALCGAPRVESLALIRELEPFDRGLYGGIVGWSHQDTSEFLVAIRSCSIIGRQARLHTGVGIVAGSNPESEWEELNQKLKLYEGILL